MELQRKKIKQRENNTNKKSYKSKGKEGEMREWYGRKLLKDKSKLITYKKQGKRKEGE